METDQDYSSFINANDYQGLLDSANTTLLHDKTNMEALKYKAKALLSLGSYRESDEIFTSIHADNNLFELARIAKTLATLDSKYKFYSSLDIIPNWFECQLLNQINKTEEEFLQLNNKFTQNSFTPIKLPWDTIQSKASVELHHLLNNLSQDVFLIGCEDVVNTFKSLETDIGYELKSQLCYPFSQVHRNGFLYTKEQNYMLPFKRDNADDHFNSDDIGRDRYTLSQLFVAPFPIIDWYIDLNKTIKNHPDADVYYSYNLISPCLHRMVTLNLDKLACKNKDYFIPMYHNIIDPNMTAIKQDSAYKWTATEFLVEETRITKFSTMLSLQLVMKRLGHKLVKYVLSNIKSCLEDKKIPKANIASPISNIPIEENKELYVIAEEILNVALPILGKITKPAILLPGKLQAVVKAQRIYLKPGEEYEGVWHRDGKHEDIVAVVIYYYRVSKQLIGGDLEFIDKQPIREVLMDDDNFTTTDAKEHLSNTPYCRIPVKSGTLVVFSNYQMIHRVLRMICNGLDPKSPDGYASRDFLLFFIVDQSKPLVSTKADLTIKKNRSKIRTQMFKEQIKPSGMFVPDTEIVCTTGNGSAVQIGWFNEAENYNWEKEELTWMDGNVEGFDNIKMMNDNPPVNRGISWVFDNHQDKNKNIYLKITLIILYPIELITIY
jgi:hypothetical protein